VNKIIVGVEIILSYQYPDVNGSVVVPKLKK